jgi:hypothetical protein
MKDHSFFLVARFLPFFLVNDIEDSYKRLYIQLKNLRGFGGMGDRFDSILPPNLIVSITCY